MHPFRHFICHTNQLITLNHHGNGSFCTKLILIDMAKWCIFSRSSSFFIASSLFAFHLFYWFIHLIKHILACISADTEIVPILIIHHHHHHHPKDGNKRKMIWIYGTKNNYADDGCETNGTWSGQWCVNNLKYANISWK